MNLEATSVTPVDRGPKGFWLDLAEIVDSLRIFPRLYLSVVTWWYIRLLDWLVSWYERIPSTERTAIVNTFALGALGSASALLGYSFKVYMAGGRKWDKLDV